MRGIAPPIRDYVAQQISLANGSAPGQQEPGEIERLRARVGDLLDRIENLEKRPQMRYCGVWTGGQAYLPGETVTFKGSLWHCNAATTARPPGPDWTLCVKSGRDGRDAGPRAGKAG
jgi:hypothetical protein